MKFNFKSFVMGTIVGATVIGGTSVFANGYEQSIQVVFNSLNLFVNNVKVNNETLLYNGTTYVPLRSTAETLNLDVEYEETTKSIYLNDKNTSVIVDKPTTSNNYGEGTRANPLKKGETGLYDNMNGWVSKFKAEITLQEVVRGKVALDMAVAANRFNSVPEDGKEYLFVKFKVNALESADDAKISINTFNFDLVSEGGVTYNDFVSVAGVEPKLTEMYAGSEQEGYAYFEVDVKDTNPTIVFKDTLWFSLK